MFYVLSLGGSIVSLKDGVNISFLKKFKRLIEDRVEKGDKFIIVVGGGSVARQYVASAKKINSIIIERDQDFIGIKATQLNAYLLKSIFGDLAFEKLIINPKIKVKSNKPLVFSGGYLPGNSSDFVAVLLAEIYGIKKIINLSNIDYVYDKNPNKFPNAKKIKEMSWSKFLKIVGENWTPGMNAPFDPVAALRCQQKNKKVLVLNGQNLSNLDNYFSGQKFKGTLIQK
ncbi:MAG: UMP kinase [Patescibacteria group bacterium]|nr:UMP kinase [Patescibacteria group bacterium]